MSNIVISEDSVLTDFNKKEVEIIQKLITQTDSTFIFNYNTVQGFYIDGNCSSFQNEFHNLITLVSESYRGFYNFILVFENNIKVRCPLYINNYKKSDKELKVLITNFYKVFFETNLSCFLTEEDLNYVSIIRDKNFHELSHIYNQIQLEQEQN